MMETSNKYLAVKNLGLLQQQAGVDPNIAELVVAFARLCTDRDQPLTFYSEDPASLERATKNYAYQWLFKRNPSLDPRLISFLVLYGNRMKCRRLPFLLSVGHLAKKRDMSEKELQYLAFNQRQFYKKLSIPKSDGSLRTLYAPRPELLWTQKWILHKILAKQKPHQAAHGFVKGKSIVSNARRHCNKEVVVRLDLEDFFPTIKFKQVRQLFQQIGYPYRVANVLANLCTLEGALPQGAPTSPAISNLVFKKVDKRLAGLAKSMKFKYSRYADDLIFSSKNPKLAQLIPLFKEILQKEGYRVNEDKVCIMRPGQRQMVTGVVVNKRPSLSRERVRQLRAVAHRLATQGPQAVVLASRNHGEHDPLNVFKGHVSFLNMINKDKARRMLKPEFET